MSKYYSLNHNLFPTICISAPPSFNSQMFPITVNFRTFYVNIYRPLRMKHIMSIIPNGYLNLGQTQPTQPQTTLRLSIRFPDYYSLKWKGLCLVYPQHSNAFSYVFVLATIISDGVSDAMGPFLCVCVYVWVVRLC